MSLNPQFGSGVLFANPNAGNLVANPTQLQFGILQEVSLELKADLKKLFGQLQMPIAKARGKINVSAKGKIASLDPMFYSQLYFGQATASGMNRPIFNEAHVAAASVAPAAGAGMANSNLGVINAATGVALVNSGSSAPGVGQYKFTAAVTGGSPTAASYAFNATDVSAGMNVLISYTWPDTVGTTLTVKNQLMGFAPEFQALLYNNFRNQTFGILLYSCVMGSLSIPTKQDDYWISDFDLDASCDASGNLLDIFSDQV